MTEVKINGRKGEILTAQNSVEVFFQSAEEARDFLNNDKDIEHFKYCAKLFHSEREA